MPGIPPDTCAECALESLTAAAPTPTHMRHPRLMESTRALADRPCGHGV